ncbi:myocardin-related transcription factor A isoform 2-T3 [Leptodactylus fuscus]|uniref:myocardin-related transcription factor A isoform X2 n=1 Tax=Leptodactylus fuscus TaxID=238119 RepID=UPI003F4F079D
MPPPSSEGVHGGGRHKKDDDESVIMEGPSAPSPKSEAIADDLQELSLQPGSEMPTASFRPKAPPLSERKNVLQLKLQQRRTREELVNQGIMPPLKSPASFHEQRKSLERARTEDYLKRKIRCRPERSELVRMHILEETTAEPSLQAKQLKLKRARLADDLNEKISQRPGPMELVVKNILPVETGLKEAIIDVNYAKVADSSSFDEDSSDALSPEQPASQDSHGSIQSPADPKPTDIVQLLSPVQTLAWVQLGSEHSGKNIPSEFLQSSNMNNNVVPVSANKPFPTLLKQNHLKPGTDKLRVKKIKDSKPKAKKLKYHQYIHPDQKQKGFPSMDSSYAKILQQQQLFLQLQIFNQQQQHYNYQTILPAPPKPLHDHQQNTAIPTTTAVRTLPTVSISTHCTPIGFKQNSGTPVTATKTGPLPGNLDDMKVAELKQELKLRGLHVSGTKVDLIERLKATQDLCTVPVQPKCASVQQPKPCEVMPVTPNVYTPSLVTDPLSLCSFSSTPPCSPCPSEVSVASADDVHTPGDLSTETVSSPVTQLIILPSPAPVIEKSSTDIRDKDFMLQEKDKQIEELTRKLKQKQELVEKLKQQLELEKRTQLPLPCDGHQPQIVQVKQETDRNTCDPSRCTEISNTIATVKREPTSLEKTHPFLSSMCNRDGRKANGLFETQMVFTVNRPSTMHADGNTSVILQTRSPKEKASQPSTQPETGVLLAQPSLSSSRSPILSIAMSPNMAFSDMKQSDFREEKEALCGSPKPDQQLNRMQANDFFTSFIQNLDLTTDCKESQMPSVKQTSRVHPLVNEVRQNELHLPSTTIPDRLEDFLEASTGTKILQGDEDGTTAMPLIDDLHSQMLSSLAILDHPTSSMDTSELNFSPEGDPLGLDTSGPHLDSMDWLELSEPPAMNLTPLSTATPSVFSTEFLDSHDLQLQWDSGL